MSFRERNVEEAADQHEAFPGDGLFPQRRPLNARSLFLGFAGVLFISGFTTFNNYVVVNTDLINSFLPQGVMLLLLLNVLLINAPLHRWAPRHAFTPGELSVAICLTLMACGVANAGLMRWLPPQLIAPFTLSNTSASVREYFEKLDLPDWMYPRLTGDSVIEKARDPVAVAFDYELPPQEGFIQSVLAVPWGAWLGAMATWSVLAGAILGGVVCMMLIFRRQWVEHERLAFPLVSVYTSLIAAPRRGHAVNELLRSRMLWTAAGLVFVLHAFNALHLYYPSVVPRIPLGYDLRPIFADGPLRFTDQRFFAQQDGIWFTIIGIMFFVQTKLAFSLWFFMVLTQVLHIYFGSFGSSMSAGMMADARLGALVPIALAILYVARGHLASVLRQMLGRRHPEDVPDPYVPLGLAGWGLAGCMVVAVGWLWLAGVSLLGSVVIIGLIMVLFLVLAKIVAETGLIYAAVPMPLNRPWMFTLQELPDPLSFGPGSGLAGQRAHYMSSLFYGLWTHDMRESLPPFASHALKLSDTAVRPASPRARWWMLVLWLLVALAVAFFVSWSASLWVHYNYKMPLMDTGEQVNKFAVEGMPKVLLFPEAMRFEPPGEGPMEPHSRWGSFAFGAGATGLLSYLRLTVAGWPLHPLGFLLATTWGVRATWFSIFIGWMCKAGIVRYGGAGLYKAARPFFLGLILGDAMAGGFWLVTSLTLAGAGMEYEPYRVLPG